MTGVHNVQEQKARQPERPAGGWSKDSDVRSECRTTCAGPCCRPLAQRAEFLAQVCDVAFVQRYFFLEGLQTIQHTLVIALAAEADGLLLGQLLARLVEQLLLVAKLLLEDLAAFRIPLLLRWGLSIARRRTGTDLLPAQLLAWYPKAAVGSGVLESLIAHHDGALDERMLKLVRMAVSFAVSCPFCVGMNSAGWEALMSDAERLAVQGL
ncbi:MAG: hypothetical protein Q8R21_01060, partial [Burkholderiales bacterium]|nr:hypothetical protein [Burkholderiales bacterium]